MNLAISLFPDIDGLDGLISDTETVLSVYAAVLAVMLAFVGVGQCLEWVKRHSPVEKILKQGLVQRSTETASAPIGHPAAERVST